MSDYLKIVDTNRVITEDIIDIDARTTKMLQTINCALNGTLYVQNYGKIQNVSRFRLIVDDVQTEMLETAYHDGNLVQVSNDGILYTGYIIALDLDPHYVDGFHQGSFTLQETMD